MKLYVQLMQTGNSVYALAYFAALGWDYFDPSEVGFKEVAILFDYVTKDLGQEAIVIDSDDLVANPGRYMEEKMMWQNRKQKQTLMMTIRRKTNEIRLYQF